MLVSIYNRNKQSRNKGSYAKGVWDMNGINYIEIDGYKYFFNEDYEKYELEIRNLENNKSITENMEKELMKNDGIRSKARQRLEV
jgi:translation elongation factor P/translation initiation factor 5A